MLAPPFPFSQGNGGFFWNGKGSAACGKGSPAACNHGWPMPISGLNPPTKTKRTGHAPLQEHGPLRASKIRKRSLPLQAIRTILIGRANGILLHIRRRRMAFPSEIHIPPGNPPLAQGCLLSHIVVGLMNGIGCCRQVFASESACHAAIQGGRNSDKLDKISLAVAFDILRPFTIQNARTA